MIYQVWLHARHPKTLETVATVRVYAHDDRLRAEAVLENAQADFQPLVLELLRVHPGALVNAEMRQQIHDETTIELPGADLGEALRRIMEMECPLTGNPNFAQLVEFWEYEKTQGRGDADDQLFALRALYKAGLIK